MRKSAVVFAGLAILATVFVACTLAAPEAKPKWEVEGSYAEACQCNVPCPCNFAQKPTYGNCDNTSVFQIEKGYYGDTRLDGLYVVAVGASPAGERYVDTVGRLTFARFYVDERANPKQRKALEEIARALNASYLRLGQAKLSADEQAKAAPIKARLTADQAQVSIPGVLDFHTQRLTGADGKSPIEIVNGSVIIEWMPRIWAGQSKTYKYSDAKKWDYSGRSAYFARFKAHSEMPTIKGSAGTHH